MNLCFAQNAIASGLASTTTPVQAMGPARREILNRLIGAKKRRFGRTTFGVPRRLRLLTSHRATEFSLGALWSAACFGGQG